MASVKEQKRQRIKKSIRAKMSGNASRPRLSVFKSNRAIYAQLIDDAKGNTLASASSWEIESAKPANAKIATLVGKKLAEKAVASGISTVVFDRNGFLYHGRIKALADGAREGGLKF